jgi:hypothetical protein
MTGSLESTGEIQKDLQPVESPQQQGRISTHKSISGFSTKCLGLALEKLLSSR